MTLAIVFIGMTCIANIFLNIGILSAIYRIWEIIKKEQ